MPESKLIPSDQLYSQEFVQSVSDWMRDCDRDERLKRGQPLKEFCSTLDPKFRKIINPKVYRQLTLTGNYLIESGKTYSLEEQISCWTTSKKVAKELKGGVHPDKFFFITVIFWGKPSPNTIVVNLGRLIKDDAFSSAVDRYKDNIKYFSQGLGKWKESQKEVVLDLSSISIDNVYAFGSFYRSEDELAQLAEKWGTTESVISDYFEELEIKPGSEKWITNRPAVKRLIGKWVFHSKRLAQLSR
jgi:hypothetical protein